MNIYKIAEEKGWTIYSDSGNPCSHWISFPFSVLIYFSLNEIGDMNEEQFVKFLRQRIEDGIYKGKIIEKMGIIPYKIMIEGD